METRIKLFNLKIVERFFLSGFLIYQATNYALKENSFDDAILVTYHFLRPIIFCFFIFSSNSNNYELNLKSLLGLLLSYGSLYYLELNESNFSETNNLIFYSSFVFYLLTFFIGLASLGRSFTVFPSASKVKSHGLYNEIRHPLYSSYLHFFLIFLITNFSYWNLFMIILFYIGLTLRAAEEEFLLLKNEPTYKNLMKKPRFFSFFMSFPLLVSLFSCIFIPNNNRSNLSINIAYPIFSTNPLLSDDWSSFFVINNVYPRISAHRNSSPVSSVFASKDVKCADNGKTIFSSNCSRIVVHYQLRSELESCSKKAYTEKDFKNELSQITQHKNWIFPNFKWCKEPNCFSFSNVSNIQHRFDSIYLRFGWSLNDINTKSFGILPNCFTPTGKLPPYNGGTIETPSIRATLSVENKNQDIYLYGNDSSAKITRNLTFFNPIYYFLIINSGELKYPHAINASFLQKLKEELILQKLIEENHLNDTLIIPITKSLKKRSKISEGIPVKIAIPDFWPNCKQIQSQLNADKSLTPYASFSCENVTLLVENDLKKGLHHWDALITPLSPGLPGNDALTIQYFNQESTDHWLGTKTPNKTEVEMLGVSNGKIQTKTSKICAVNPNALGLSDILLSDFKPCQ